MALPEIIENKHTDTDTQSEMMEDVHGVGVEMMDTTGTDLLDSLSPNGMGTDFEAEKDDDNTMATTRTNSFDSQSTDTSDSQSSGTDLQSFMSPKDLETLLEIQKDIDAEVGGQGTHERSEEDRGQCSRTAKGIEDRKANPTEDHVQISREAKRSSPQSTHTVPAASEGLGCHSAGPSGDSQPPLTSAERNKAWRAMHPEYTKAYDARRHLMSKMEKNGLLSQEDQQKLVTYDSLCIRFKPTRTQSLHGSRATTRALIASSEQRKNQARADKRVVTRALIASDEELKTQARAREEAILFGKASKKKRGASHSAKSSKVAKHSAATAAAPNPFGATGSIDPNVFAAQQAAFMPSYGAIAIPFAPFGGGMMPFAPLGMNPMLAMQQQQAAAATLAMQQQQAAAATLAMQQQQAAAATYAASMASQQPSYTDDTSDESSDDEE